MNRPISPDPEPEDCATSSSTTDARPQRLRHSLGRSVSGPGPDIPRRSGMAGTGLTHRPVRPTYPGSDGVARMANYLGRSGSHAAARNLYRKIADARHEPLAPHLPEGCLHSITRDHPPQPQFARQCGTQVGTTILAAACRMRRQRPCPRRRGHLVIQKCLFSGLAARLEVPGRIVKANCGQAMISSARLMSSAVAAVTADPGGNGGGARASRPRTVRARVLPGSQGGVLRYLAFLGRRPSYGMPRRPRAGNPAVRGELVGRRLPKLPRAEELSGFDRVRHTVSCARSEERSAVHLALVKRPEEPGHA